MFIISKDDTKIKGFLYGTKGFPGGSAGKKSTCNVGDLGLIPGLGRYLEKGKATHFSILAWRIVHGDAKSWT